MPFVMPPASRAFPLELTWVPNSIEVHDLCNTTEIGSRSASSPSRIESHVIKSVKMPYRCDLLARLQAIFAQRLLSAERVDICHLYFWRPRFDVDTPHPHTVGPVHDYLTFEYRQRPGFTRRRRSCGLVMAQNEPAID